MRYGLRVGLLVSLPLIVACNGQSGPMSPVTPSPALAPAGPTGSSSGATVTGTVVLASGPQRSRGISAMDAGGLTITVVGTGVSSGVSSNGEFSLQGVPPGVVQIRVTGAGVDATFTLSDVQAGQVIQVRVTVSGNTGIVEQDSRQKAGELQIEGRVELPPGSDGVFVVAGRKVHVTEGVTEIRKGNTPGVLADIKVGVRVHVKGALGTGPDPVVEAREVKLQNEQEDLPAQLEFEGRIDASPAPAAGQFYVGGRKVVYDGSTTFAGGTAADLEPGTSVEVRGTLVTTATPAYLKAARIQIEDGGDLGATHDVEGVVTGGISGSCPSLRFSLLAKNGRPYDVQATSTTAFEPACATLQLAKGDQVEVTGALAGSTITATRIEKKTKK